MNIPTHLVRMNVRSSSSIPLLGITLVLHAKTYNMNIYIYVCDGVYINISIHIKINVRVIS